MKIGSIDLSERVMIVAELSANHGHDIDIAKRTIKSAKDCGADAIKVQTYTADTLTIQCSNEYFTLNSGTIWDGKTLYDLYNDAFLPWEWHYELMKYANDLGLVFFSTPFDHSAVDFLEKINVPAYKVASFEIVDTELIEYIASKQKPIILSTGIASLGDIEDAIHACHKAGNYQIVLLKCTSSYPAKIEDANLLTMANMKQTFNTEVGLSDHTLGISVAVASVALGARVIEKHFILDKSIGGPDSLFSMEPTEFASMVKSVREVEKAIGSVDYTMTESKLKNKKLARSLFVVENMKEGDVFTNFNVRSIRPGYGLSPKFLPEIIGKVAAMNIERGTPISWGMIR